MKTFIIVATFIATLASAAFAHSGGTDAKGCHHDHIHGGYHCH